MRNLDEFTLSYVTCALWSSTDESTPEGGEPMDKNYGIEDISEECLAQMVKDCESFQAAHSEQWYEYSDDARAGYHFWLTRNGHGAGFWDGDYPKDIGDNLTAAAHAYGEVTLYVGDDGLIYAG